MKKFIIIFLLSFVSLFGQFSGGTGTKLDPYLITKTSEFLSITDWTKYYQQENDLNFDTVSTPYTFAGWQNTNMSGGYDGQSYKIIGLKVIRYNLGSSYLYAGLFNELTMTADAKFKRITFVGLQINQTSTKDDAVVSSLYFGGFIAGKITTVSGSEFFDIQILNSVLKAVISRPYNTSKSYYYGFVTGLGSSWVRYVRVANSVIDLDILEVGAGASTDNTGRVYISGQPSTASPAFNAFEDIYIKLRTDRPFSIYGLSYSGTYFASSYVKGIHLVVDTLIGYATTQNSYFAGAFGTATAYNDNYTTGMSEVQINSRIPFSLQSNNNRSTTISGNNQIYIDTSASFYKTAAVSSNSYLVDSTFMRSGSALFDYVSQWSINPLINDGYPYLANQSPYTPGEYFSWIDPEPLDYYDYAREYIYYVPPPPFEVIINPSDTVIAFGDTLNYTFVDSLPYVIITENLIPYDTIDFTTDTYSYTPTSGGNKELIFDAYYYPSDTTITNGILAYSDAETGTTDGWVFGTYQGAGGTAPPSLSIDYGLTESFVYEHNGAVAAGVGVKWVANLSPIILSAGDTVTAFFDYIRGNYDGRFGFSTVASTSPSLVTLANVGGNYLNIGTTGRYSISYVATEEITLYFVAGIYVTTTLHTYYFDNIDVVIGEAIYGLVLTPIGSDTVNVFVSSDKFVSISSISSNDETITATVSTYQIDSLDFFISPDTTNWAYYGRQSTNNYGFVENDYNIDLRPNLYGNLYLKVVEARDTVTTYKAKPVANGVSWGVPAGICTSWKLHDFGVRWGQDKSCGWNANVTKTVGYNRMSSSGTVSQIETFNSKDNPSLFAKGDCVPSGVLGGFNINWWDYMCDASTTSWSVNDELTYNGRRFYKDGYSIYYEDLINSSTHLLINLGDDGWGSFYTSYSPNNSAFRILDEGKILLSNLPPSDARAWVITAPTSMPPLKTPLSYDIATVSSSVVWIRDYFRGIDPKIRK